MVRVSPAPIDGSDAPLEAISRIRALRGGEISKLYRTLLHAPEVAAGWCELGTAVRWRSSLDDQLRELLTCLVASLGDASYEWRSHAPLALEAGITTEQLDSLPIWSTCASFSDRQKAALAYGEAVATGTVDDEIFERTAAIFDRRELVEMAAICAYYVSIGRFLDACGVR